MPLRAVTLDAGGTLFDVAAPVGAVYARIARRHGIDVDADALALAFDTAVGIAPPLAFPGVAPDGLDAAERGWWRAVVAATFGPAAASPRFDACFAAAWEHYAEPAAWRLDAEATAMLALLRARRLRLAVVSNFDGRLPPLLEAMGLGSLVDAVVYSSAVGAAKPAPAIFHVALDRLGVAPDEALHIGDSRTADVAGAHGAGMHAVLLDRHGTAATDGPAIRRLAELPALVAAHP